MNLKLQGGQTYNGTEPIPVVADMFTGPEEFYVVGMQHGERVGYAISMYAPLDSDSMLFRRYEDAQRTLERLKQEPGMAGKDLNIYRMRVSLESD